MSESSKKESTIKRMQEKRISTSDISDLLWTLGYNLAVPRSILTPLQGAYIAGEVTTMLYLPQRKNAQHSENRLNHVKGYSQARKGNIVVMIGDREESVSILGGNAVKLAIEKGIGGFLVDGAVRDVEEIAESGMAVWARGITPKTGRYRLELFETNCPVAFCGVQVRPGDIAVADRNGACFVPEEILDEVDRRLT